MENDSEKRKGPFYMVYESMINEFGTDIANIISVMLKHQEYLKRFGRLDRDGYFYMEHKMIEKKTGISEHRQKIAMKELEEYNFLKIAAKRKGIPPKKFYKVKGELYIQFLIDMYNPEETSE
jgi:hypothetical protein